MKTLQLWVDGKGYQSFEYEKIEDLKDELTKRLITISYRASIGDRASIGNEASIGYRASIGNEASIGNGASIGDGASIGNEASIVKTLFITGSRHTVTWYNDIIHIGCHKYTIQEWLNHFKSIGEKEGYTPEEINEYHQYILICKQMYNNLQP